MFCNKAVSGSSSAELLAGFCDNILKKGGSEKLSDEAIEETLEKVFCSRFFLLRIQLFCDNVFLLGSLILSINIKIIISILFRLLSCLLISVIKIFLQNSTGKPLF